MAWTVDYKKKCRKQLDAMPKTVKDAMFFLVREMKELGPLRYNWQNFSKLKGLEGHYHCHLKQGKPTYVACWEVVNKKIQIIEVYYVGTHEKAPY